MPQKILTWNTLGDASNQHQWIQSWTNNHFTFNGLDLAVFIESGAGGHFNGSQVVQESGGSGFVLPPAGSTNFEAACTSLLGKQTLTPFGGVGRHGYYELYSPAGRHVPGATVVDFGRSRGVVEWVLRPLEPYIIRNLLGAGPPSVGRGGGPVRHSARSSAQTSSYGNKPTWLKQEWVSMADDQKHRIREQVQQRANLLGQRRPMHITLNGDDIYFWHAPLGTQTLDSVGLSKAAVGQGCNGDLAVACNQLLAIYLKVQKWDASARQWQTRAFPPATYLVGDLNINELGVQTIYGAPAASASRDGWCHVVRAAGIRANAYTDNRATSSQPPLSDHDPVAIY